MFRFFSRETGPRDNDLLLVFVPPASGPAGESAQFLTPSFLFADGKALLSRADWDASLLSRELFFGEDSEGRALWIVEATRSPPGAQLVAYRHFLATAEPDLALAAMKGTQLLHWMKSHRFCGTCGNPTKRRWEEFVLVCPVCGTEVYPRINPAVIMVVHRGDEIILARNSRFQLPIFSCLAGYVEAGERLEETVIREVREEVAVEVGEPRYVASQSWPFPNSLMLGFHAPWISGEPVPDGVEIAEAGWFTRDHLPQLPGEISLARKLIRSFFNDPAL